MAFYSFFVEMFVTWINIFIAPLEDPTMLWVLVPTYFNWVFTEFYQEKHGTSLGNAISNSLIPLWVGWDWSRTLYNGFAHRTIIFDFASGIKVAIATGMIFYGFNLLIQGIKLSEKVKFIGRIRVVTYVVLMMTPFFYGINHFTWASVSGIIVFFPVYYFIIEFFDRIIPDPRAFTADQKKDEVEEFEPNFTIEQPYQPPQQDPRFAPQQYQNPYGQVRR